MVRIFRIIECTNHTEKIALESEKAEELEYMTVVNCPYPVDFTESCSQNDVLELSKDSFGHEPNRAFIVVHVDCL